MRDADAQITFSDLEFMSQGIQLDPVLEHILRFVVQNAALVEAVRTQLHHGLKKPQTGRSGLTAEQAILSLILMRIKNLGLSGAGGTHRRWVHAATIHPVLQPSRAQA